MAMSVIAEESFLKDLTFTKPIDELSEGIQILREYIFFNNFNFLKQCQLYDKLDLGKLAIPKFETALKKSPFHFSDRHIQEIIHEAPKSRKGEIMYRQLNLLLTKGEKPKSKLTAKTMQSHSNSMILGGESPKKEGDNFESILAQFFALKTLHDFQHFDLNNLDIPLLQHKNKPEGNVDEVAIKNIYASNNLALIENFQISVASKIYDVLVNQEKMISNSEQVLFGLTYYLKKAQHETYSAFTQLDLQTYLHKFNIELTLDEADFLYFLIYAGFGENVLNLKCTALWVQAYHNKRVKHVFQTTELLSNMPTALFKRIDIPIIYQDIIKIIQEIGFEKIETALHQLETHKGISFEGFQRFLRQYNISFTSDHFSQLKLWLAQEGILEISFDEDPIEGKTFIVLNRLLSALRKTCQDLHIPFTLPENANLTLEGAVIAFNRKVLQTYWKNIEENILVFGDNFRMINELKLREILKDMVHGLDNTILNRIFASFKYSEEISRGNLQKRIFADEFLAKVRDVNFDPILVPKKPEQKAYVEPLGVQNINLGGQTQKVGIQPEDTDPKRVLDKLQKVLDDLMKSPSLYIRPEERNITTLPLLKIFESYDNEKKGYLEKKVFKQVLVESFPVFNKYEIEIILNMADRMSFEHDKGQPSLDPNSGSQTIQTTHISYYYFLLQIEKYFELNKVCEKRKG